MKQQIESLIQAAIKQLQAAGELPEFAVPPIHLDATKDKQHGDYATNIAMLLAKPAKKNPREIAELIKGTINDALNQTVVAGESKSKKSSHVEELITHAHNVSSSIAKLEIAGPGFINIFLTPSALTEIVKIILKEKDRFGTSNSGQGKTILVEFLSSNPTGPLHVGHGRHGAIGSIVSNLLDAIGFKTYREYYVNDAGRQMDILAVSIWLRYLNILNEDIPFPDNAYRGDYVKDIAQHMRKQFCADFHVSAPQVLANLPLDESQGGDKEIYIDAVIVRAKSLLSEKYETILNFGLKSILADMENDLTEFGVHYDNWFSERDFVATNEVNILLQKLRDSGHVYELEGALWFRSTDFGDAKDRVVERSNGTRTYFANDLVYHLSKFHRGFDLAIDIFGSDHHGYVPRMKAAMQACGIEQDRLIYLLVQFVSLYRGNEQVSMSTRGGSFVTLRELRNEVGNDAARFFYVMRKYDQPIDFDLDLAKSQSNENPVYYVQYAHARICSVFKQLKDRNLTYDEKSGLQHLTLLTEPQERQLLNTLSRYPDIINNAALQYEPHLLTNYLRDLATDFHSYYNSHQFIVEDGLLCNARLALIGAVKQTLLNGFNLLGISAPETM